MKKLSMLALLLAVGTLAGCAQLPTAEPTQQPSAEPTVEPTQQPTIEPTVEPTQQPTIEPTVEPTVEPTQEPTVEPTAEPTPEPTVEPSVEAPIESIEPGVIPSGGQDVSIPEIDFSGENLPEFIVRDGFSIKVVNSELAIDYSSKTESNFDWKYGVFYDQPVTEEAKQIMKVEEVNAEATVLGLSKAEDVNQFGAFVGASAKVTYSSDGQYLLNGDLLDASAHLKDGNVYFTIGEKVMELISAGGESEMPSKFYLPLPADLEEMFSEQTGLLLPLLSETNISFIEQMIKQMLESQVVPVDDYYEEEGQIQQLTDEQIQQLVEIIFSHIISITQYDTQYLLSINLSSENLESVCEAVLSDLYKTGLLDVFMDNESPLTPVAFEELKAEMKEMLKETEDYFSHFKLSILFDEVMVKAIALDTKLAVMSGGGSSMYITDTKTGEEKEAYENWEERYDVSVKLNIEFSYSDELSIEYPSFDGYVEAPMSEPQPEVYPSN